MLDNILSIIEHYKNLGKLCFPKFFWLFVLKKMQKYGKIEEVQFNGERS